MSTAIRFMDRLHAFLNPSHLIRMNQALLLNDLVDVERKRAAFKAAETDRLNQFWTASSQDINKILSTELSTMRNRSRWLLRNNGSAISVVNALVNYVVGTGYKPQAIVQRRSSDGSEWEDDEPLNLLLEDLWEEFAENCDYAGTAVTPRGFIDACELWLRRLIEDGEVLIHFVPDRKYGPVPLKIEFIDPANLDCSLTEYQGNPITMGVELSKTTNEPVAYWLTTTTGQSRRIKAEMMLHSFVRMHTGQVRGFPWLAGVLDTFFKLNEYEDAELLTAKIAACFSVFIKLPKGFAPTGDMLAATGRGDVVDSNGTPISHIQPGLIAKLPQGAEINFAQPQKPGATFGLFTKHLQRRMGAGVIGGLSYEAMTRDTSQVTFASGRLGQLMDFQNYRRIQRFQVRLMCSPIYNKFIEYAKLANEVSRPSNFEERGPARTNRHKFIPGGWQWGINPAQESQAIRENMRMGLSSLDDECAYVGREATDTLRAIAKIKKQATKMGLTLTSDGSVSVYNGVTAETQQVIEEQMGAAPEPDDTPEEE